MKGLIDEACREQLLKGTLSWIHSNLNYFCPPQENELLEIAPEAIKPDKTRKAYCELGIALFLTSRIPELSANPEIRWLKNEWMEMANKRQFFFDIRRRSSLLPHRIVASVAFHSFGYPLMDVRESLQAVLDRGFIERAEVSAWSKLDLKYYMDLANLRHSYASDETLLNESSLTGLANLPYATAHDLYGLTHLIFHFSDFGKRDMHSFMGGYFHPVLEYTELALSMSLSMQDWDLAIELLITRICLGVENDLLDQEAVRVLCEYQQSAGFMPGRAWMRGYFDDNERQACQEEEFFDVYHPTLLVLFLLCCDAQRTQKI